MPSTPAPEPAAPTNTPAPASDPMGGEMGDGMDGGLGAGPQIDGGAQGGGDDINGIYNQLSDTDKKAVRSYAESMLSRDEDKNNDGIPDAGGMGDGMPMQETFIFKKSQLDEMNENFGPMADELDDRQEDRKKNNKRFKDGKGNSPFKSPKFN